MKDEKYRIVIAGGRDFNNYERLKVNCDALLGTASALLTVEVVSGTARGADSLGEKYAEEKGYEVKKFPADWNSYGKRAGIYRNRRMASYADAAIVFWNGTSKGTKNMIDEMRARGKHVSIIRY